MPLLQGILQILIEHEDMIWQNRGHLASRRKNRPLSVLFVGSNLTLLNQEEMSAPSGLISFRSLSRASPGCASLPDIDPSESESEGSEADGPTAADALSPHSRKAVAPIKRFGSALSNDLLSLKIDLSNETTPSGAGDRRASGTDSILFARPGAFDPPERSNSLAGMSPLNKRANRKSRKFTAL